MNQWIAFIRGINVGGRHILPMKELQLLLVATGCEDVRTYIQSGNVVFRHREKRPAVLQETISSAISAKFAFDPAILLLTVEQLHAACRGNPFPAGEGDPKTLHLYFLAAKPDQENSHAMDELKTATEAYRLIDRVLYLHAPDGIGRSKLAGKVERCLGVPVTARNWRTVQKVLQLASS